MLTQIKQYAAKFSKPGFERRLGYDNAGRKLLVWGYNASVRKGLTPIESLPVELKEELWKAALEHERTTDVRIQIVKALYFLMQ